MRSVRVRHFLKRADIKVIPSPAFYREGGDERRYDKYAARCARAMAQTHGACHCDDAHTHTLRARTRHRHADRA